ncbi:pyridoxal phosphate-dependent aminotransferase [Roseovarius sp. SCSIO 43702]|uniref:pyridoxal phosphate-dependent aminotransferase n=1 Tax=Roseovarius sp. SCSIO 43702 TaxID=2823043 RepID=UPI001C72A1F2|nr:pyridoxal phosphate-dependent aminotransferase [Roseovarius sp. SCSIO 43702]QYX57408.1 pyridoxal phosphate-dependent aminotransferase [Roseovarius sp. SCSIO 43702]
MRFSETIRNMTGGGSDGWDVVRKAARMEREGTPVTHLTLGEHDIRTDPMILEAMYRSAMDGATGYMSFEGDMGLRSRIAARLTARTGVETTPENVLIVPGGQGGLFATHHAVCDPGDRALYIDPYYTTYPGTIRTVGAVPVAIEARADRNFQPDEADIAAVAEGARSILVNTPNNPTGVVYTRDTLEGIGRVARDNDLWIISDEVYDTQVWIGDHVSLRALPGLAERTLVVGSMSKSHAMTGSRVGWVVGPEEAIHHMTNLATNTTYGVPGYIQHAAAFALDQGEAFEEKIAEPFRRRRDLVAKLMEGQNAARAIPADGAMYVMVDIRATGLSGEDFANRLLDEHHVAVMPGESFGKAAAGHLRVALTVADERLEEAVARLIELANDLAAGRQAS